MPACESLKQKPRHSTGAFALGFRCALRFRLEGDGANVLIGALARLAVGDERQMRLMGVNAPR